jgi:hypothetical protein
MFTFAIVAQAAPHGTIASTTSAATTEMIGATAKMAWSALIGIMSSLSNNFSPSAAGCSNPQGPTRIGPSLACINADTFRSK